LQQDLKTSRGLHEEMKKAASNNVKQVKYTLHFEMPGTPELLNMTIYNCYFILRDLIL